jgi:hypothetical protein
VSTTYQIPEYLLSGSGCEQLPNYANPALCRGNHAEAVKQDAATGRWFITMGHPGFNSPANNRDGYASAARAFGAMLRYGRPR